jgi:putative transposase
MIAAHLRKRRPRPHTTWHLDEVYLKIDGRMVYLWRAVDTEGGVLDVLVQSKRDKHAALKSMRNLLEKYAFARERLVTTTYGHMAQRPAISASSTCTSAAGGRTIGPRIRISLAAAGAQDAAFQERRLRSEIPLGSRRRVQHFQLQRHLTSAQSHRVSAPRQ